jgi:hypothetical protein
VQGHDIDNTYTAPLPASTSTVQDSPIQPSLSYDPDRAPLPMSLGGPLDTKQSQGDIKGNVYRPPDDIAAAQASAHPAPSAPATRLPPLTGPPKKLGSAIPDADLSLSQLAGRLSDVTENMVTPVTSAREPAKHMPPATDVDAELPAPQLSAASLVREDTAEDAGGLACEGDAAAKAGLDVEESPDAAAMVKRPHENLTDGEPIAKVRRAECFPVQHPIFSLPTHIAPSEQE